jgi:hypothetical protein
MRDIKESDWKHFRDLHPVLLDRHCQRLLQEFGGICSDAGKGSHQRYLDLYKLIHKRDKELGNLFDDLKRSTAILQIMLIHKHGLFTPEEFAQFSQELRERVQNFP